MQDDFKSLSKFVDSLKNTSSTLDKVEIIGKIESRAGSEFIKQVLLYVYHPMWQYHVTSDNLKKKCTLRGKKYSSLFSLLDDLKETKITGHDAIGAINSFVESYLDYEELIHCIIDKDLKTRAGDKLINKAIPDFIPTFSVALADKYNTKIVSWKDDWYVSTKIDGVRCIAIVDDSGNSTFFSRTGKPFDTLGVISDGIKALGITGVIFDGELCLVDDDGKEDFQGVMKELRKKDHTIPNPSYKIFDMLNADEFYSQKGKANNPFSVRLKKLQKAMVKNECSCLTILDQKLIKNQDDFQELIQESTDKGWEGLMLRADKPYKGKRSKDLLKYKAFSDAEYEVVDTEMGPFRYIQNGKECEETMLSSVIISHKDNLVGVGSGFSVEQRQEFYKNPKKILGKVINVQYFEETKNQDGGISLRFPTFKYLYGEERDT